LEYLRWLCVRNGLEAAYSFAVPSDNRWHPLPRRFLSDLFSWGAIGARTTESQVHRELASGMSSPIGFKNSTAGDVQIAVDAIRSCATTHSFLGVSKMGVASIVHTAGNPHCHVILRGGKGLTNFDAESIAAAKALHTSAKVRCRVMVDCSHGNSKKQAKNQPAVASSVAKQVSGAPLVDSVARCRLGTPTQPQACCTPGLNVVVPGLSAFRKSPVRDVPTDTPPRSAAR
jgi:3-deoxy-D-arabino-heptulosonate 7-phosphate (DAHP) synthase